MGFKMLTAFMISRSHCRTSLVTKIRFARRGSVSLGASRRSFVTVIGLTFFTAACQKVPLLAPSGSTIVLTSSQTAVSSAGTAQLVAQLLEPAGTPPHRGTHVIFTTSLGTIEPSEVETDVNGQARATFRPGGLNGTAVITATSGGASTGTNPVRILVGAAAVGKVNISANPATVPFNGGTVTVEANVLDVNGNPLPSVPVSFTTTAGTLSVSVATSDGNGNAQTALNTNRQTTVTATAGTTSTTTTPPAQPTTGGTTPPPTSGGTTSSVSTASVTINVNALASFTLGTPTPATPTVDQIVSIPVTVPTATGGTTSPIVRVTVNWGDGSPEQTYTSLPNVITHVFKSFGSFLVTVAATDSFGDTASQSAAVAVGPKLQPTVSITPSGSPQVNTVTTFTIAATASTGSTITSMQVDFGDGTIVPLPGNATSVQHEYKQAGPFTVVATATDSSGASNSGATRIVVGGQAPAQLSAPSDLAADPVSSTQINLMWTASSSVGVTAYRVERCTGSTCSNFVEVGTSTDITFNNTGLTAGTTYRYRVRARDAAGNVSPYSSVVLATTP
jgi:hypothetical protein